MHDPWQVMSTAVRRGALLGVVWAVVFFASALVLFLALAGLGWSGVARALCAMAAGPLIATVAIALWWMVRQPTLIDTPPPAQEEDADD